MPEVELNRPLEEILKEIPELPGVYIFSDFKGYPLYVGKSLNLRARVRAHLRGSYFAEISAKLEYILTESEEEALKLEFQLIRNLKPPFNIQYSDEWGIRGIGVIDLGDGYPTFLPLSIRGDKISSRAKGKLITFLAPLYGPLKSVLRWLGETFKVRTCPYNLKKYKPKGCIYEVLGRCSAPCKGMISEEDYMRNVEEAVRALKEGISDEFITELEAEMWRLADELRFEEAAAVRDKIQALKRLRTSLLIDPRGEEKVFLTSYRGRKYLWVAMMRSSDWGLSRPELYKYSPLEVSYRLSSVLSTRSGTVIADDEVLRVISQFSEVLEKLGLKIREPVGKAEEESLALLREELRNRVRIEEGISLLQEIIELLQLEALERIEAVDLSHFSGRNSYGALVVWKEGGFSRKDYRLFKVPEGGDDLAGIRELMHRRAKYLAGYGRDPSLNEKPDLIIIDGGEAQLTNAIKGFNAWGEHPNVRVVAMVKPEDDLILSQDGDLRRISLKPEIRRFLAKIRNEAHRFSNYARKRSMKVKIL